MWVDTTFSDPFYWFACWHKSFINEVLAREGAVSGPKYCLDGGGGGGSGEGGCCGSVEVDSDGFAEFDQVLRFP